MTNENCISELLNLQEEKITDDIKSKIKSRIEDNNDVNSIIEAIEINFSDYEKYENFTCKTLYKHLAFGKKFAQLALNSFKKNDHQCEPSISKKNIHEKYLQYYKTIKQKKVDEDFLIDRISYYIMIFSLLSYKEFSEICEFCATPLSIKESTCSICGGPDYDKKEIKNANRKSNEAIDLCYYCNNELLNGICQICLSESKSSKTNMQKKNKGNDDRSVKMRSNSSELSHNSKIKSNPSSQWTCNVCSYNENNNNNINCEVCMSSKFAKINSCVFESSFEASTENEIYSVKHVENIENKPTENIEKKPTENIDKWSCTECTYNNEITVDLCFICLAPNLNKVGTMDDYELPEETWCCKRCRKNNLFECYKCKNCREPAEFYNKWRCGQCSFYNHKVAKRCGACEIENPYLVKCNLCVKLLVNKMYDKLCKECTVLSERCTNKEAFDYQDNRGAPLETSTEGNQRRYKRNENQNNPRNVPQNTEPKRKDSTVDKKRKCKETGNKRQSETTEFFYSLPQEDENSKQQSESKTILKSTDSQNVGRKDSCPNVNADSNCQKTGNLTIYNVVKTQPETSATDKSLSKGDRNSGKLNEIQIKSNVDIQQNIEKQTPSVVKTTSKTNSRPCKNCKSKVCANNQYWCTKCENFQWYCQNEACNGINFKNEYCKQCKSKSGSNFSNCNNFEVMKEDGKEVQMWQCAFCMQFNAGRSMKCQKCQNLRYISNYKKCECNWTNLHIKDKCDKCNKDLIKYTKL